MSNSRVRRYRRTSARPGRREPRARSRSGGLPAGRGASRTRRRGSRSGAGVCRWAGSRLIRGGGRSRGRQAARSQEEFPVPPGGCSRQRPYPPGGPLSFSRVNAVPRRRLVARLAGFVPAAGVPWRAARSRGRWGGRLGRSRSRTRWCGGWRQRMRPGCGPGRGRSRRARRPHRAARPGRAGWPGGWSG